MEREAGEDGGIGRWKGEGEGVRGMKMFRRGVLGTGWINGRTWEGGDGEVFCWMMRLVFWTCILK